MVLPQKGYLICPPTRISHCSLRKDISFVTQKDLIDDHKNTIPCIPQKGHFLCHIIFVTKRSFSFSLKIKEYIWLIEIELNFICDHFMKHLVWDMPLDGGCSILEPSLRTNNGSYTPSPQTLFFLVDQWSVHPTTPSCAKPWFNDLSFLQIRNRK